jgi:hypothetical protein
MDLYPGLIFRFKILPFLQNRILPLYEEILHSQKKNINLNSEETYYLQIFSKFCGFVFKRNFDVKITEVDVNDTMIFWELIQKLVLYLSPIFYKINVSNEEKEIILSKFALPLRDQIKFLLV